MNARLIMILALGIVAIAVVGGLAGALVSAEPAIITLTVGAVCGVFAVTTIRQLHDGGRHRA